jgi:hypothetical protein
MMKPKVDIYECSTGEVISREMTDEEYAELLASGWTPEAVKPDPE